VERDLERFAAALKDSEKADKAAREREQQARDDAATKVEQAAEHARSLTAARRELERAVEAVRQAKQHGRGRAEADAAWKVAKATVIELETGTAPSWAPKPPPAPEPPAQDHAGHDSDESPSSLSGS